jgi:hypothetical protein
MLPPPQPRGGMLAVPVYPPQPADAIGPAWKLGLIWSLAAAHGTLWAGTLPGGLFRSTDDGASFDTLADGLPGADCDDLVDRHGLAVADDGRHLLMGSTTGGLWSSRDGGGRWATVSSTLPPIYAVRFG